jgi:hypothetical protein
LLKDISLEYTLYHFYFKDWREKIGIYFSLILLNSYFAKLFEKLNFSWFYFRLAGGKLRGGFLYWL